MAKPINSLHECMMGFAKKMRAKNVLFSLYPSYCRATSNENSPLRIRIAKPSAKFAAASSP